MKTALAISLALLTSGSAFAAERTGYLVPGPTYRDSSREATGYLVPGPTWRDPYTGRPIDNPLSTRECLINGVDPGLPYASCWGSSSGGGGD